MADEEQSQKNEEPRHRGRIQAQGGGTEKSVSWTQAMPPTEREMLEKCDQLEGQLNSRELRDRERPMTQLRQLIQAAAQGGGLSAPVSKSFRKKGSSEG
jgi:hypothetical protein